jgi:surfeit locus 1 family protein
LIVRRRGIVTATLFALAGIGVLCALGQWQLDRKIWKEKLIATMTVRLTQPPQPLPSRNDWPQLTQDNSEFTRVTFPAEFLAGEEALVYSAGAAFRPDIKDPGYWVFAPAQLAGGSIVVVNRGYVPPDRRDPAARQQGNPPGSVDVVGVMRWPETRGLFTPADDVKGNVWYLRDPLAMAQAHRWATAAPFYIDMEAPMPPGGLPSPGKLTVILPNNHWQYAITWFGLALALAGVFIAWLIARLRRAAD